MTRKHNAKNIGGRVEEYMQAMTQSGKFAGSVLLAHKGKVLHSAGYGLADREHGIANTPQTKFRIGSITKQFTAMAIMILAEQGRLSVHDAISRHLPYSPEHWKDITIHHLLNHTAGLPNLTNFPGSFDTTAKMALPVRDVVETFREKALEFTPGSKHRYSNSGYILLGDIIERASGVSYESFLREHIFDPLEMADSGYDHYETILAHRATGYSRQDGEWSGVAYLDMSYPFAAGALYSTVEDLYKWDRALLAGRLISSESHARMTMVAPLLANYGYGLAMGRQHNRNTVEHAGGIHGFRANLVRFPDEPACAIALSNFEGSDFIGVTTSLAAILFGEKYEVPAVKSPVTISDAALAAYAGAYEMMSGVTLYVESKDGRLLVTSGKARGRFQPESETVFFHEDSEDVMTFHTCGEARVSHLTLRQQGVEVKARRI